MLRLFSSGHLAIIPIAVASGSIAGSAPVVLTEWKLSPARVSSLKYIKCVAQHRTTYTDSPWWLDYEGSERREKKEQKGSEDEGWEEWDPTRFGGNRCPWTYNVLVLHLCTSSVTFCGNQSCPLYVYLYNQRRLAELGKLGVAALALLLL